METKCHFYHKLLFVVGELVTKRLVYCSTFMFIKSFNIHNNQKQVNNYKLLIVTSANDTVEVAALYSTGIIIDM